MIRNSLFSDVQVFIHTLSALIVLSSSLIIIFILYLFYKNKHLIKNTINIFILNIIINDLLKCIIYIPIVNISFHIVLEMLRNYSDGIRPAISTQRLILCNLNCATGVFFETIQLIGMILISFERYKIIVSPPKTSRRQFQLAKGLIYASWVVSLLFTFVVFVVISQADHRLNTMLNRLVISYR